MAVKLNKKAYRHARSLIKAGRVVHDERDDWSDVAPSAVVENKYIAKNGYSDYGDWYLAVDTRKRTETKGHYKFPYGDFKQVRRGGVISLESRAAQGKRRDIAKAARKLLKMIDSKSGKRGKTNG